MDDPADMGSVRKAIDREQCVLLRQNLRGTLEQLKDARQVVHWCCQQTTNKKRQRNGVWVFLGAYFLRCSAKYGGVICMAKSLYGDVVDFPNPDLT